MRCVAPSLCVSPEHVVAELVVTCKCDERAPSEPDGEEDLGSGVAPHLEGGELVPLRHQVPLDTVHGSGQCQAPDQEDGQDQVGEGCCHIDHLIQMEDTSSRLSKSLLISFIQAVEILKSSTKKR